MTTLNNLQHPSKSLVPMAVGLAWGKDGAIYQQKLDGEFATRAVNGGILAGEQMPAGDFIAWDCIQFEGLDVRDRAAETRALMRDSLCRVAGLPVVKSHYAGGALLQAVLASGGEGIVRKLPTDTYYDPMTACKRLQTWRCVVISRAGGQSVGIADAITGEPRGKVTLRGGKCDQVRVGSIIKVEGLDLHASGMIRDPRPCKDTPTSWLIKV